MKNVVELRNELSKLFGEIKAKTVDPKTAKEMNNAAGKILGTLKVQLSYADLRKEKPNIEFLYEGQ